MKTPEEQYYYLSCWYTDEISLSRLNFLFADNISSQRLIDIYKRVVSDMWAQHSVSDNFNRERMKAHLRAWSNLFVSENHILTSSIAHQNMYGTYANHKMICYGSAIDGTAINYALHATLADQLKLHRVYSVSITDPYGDVRFIKCATIGGNGNLEWRQITEDDLPENDPFFPTTRETQENT